MAKTQVFFIHGGMTFKNYRDYWRYLSTREVLAQKRARWTDGYLEKNLGSHCEIIRPRMPLSDNAKYKEWKLAFERYFSLLRNNIILVGCSLGGIFLAKYLSENKFPKKILSTYLVCAPFDNSLPEEDLVGGFKLKSDLSLLEKNSPRLNLLFAQKDDVVPVYHAQKYAAKLKQANIVIYKHIKGHFKMAEFPEIIKMIKADIRRER